MLAGFALKEQKSCAELMHYSRYAQPMGCMWPSSVHTAACAPCYYFQIHFQCLAKQLNSICQSYQDMLLIFSERFWILFSLRSLLKSSQELFFLKEANFGLLHLTGVLKGRSEEIDSGRGKQLHKLHVNFNLIVTQHFLKIAGVQFIKQKVVICVNL